MESSRSGVDSVKYLRRDLKHPHLSLTTFQSIRELCAKPTTFILPWLSVNINIKKGILYSTAPKVLP